MTSARPGTRVGVVVVVVVGGVRACDQNVRPSTVHAACDRAQHMEHALARWINCTVSPPRCSLRVTARGGARSLPRCIYHQRDVTSQTRRRKSLPNGKQERVRSLSFCQLPAPRASTVLSLATAEQRAVDSVRASRLRLQTRDSWRT